MVRQDPNLWKFDFNSIRLKILKNVNKANLKYGQDSQFFLLRIQLCELPSCAQLNGSRMPSHRVSSKIIQFQANTEMKNHSRHNCWCIYHHSVDKVSDFQPNEASICNCLAIGSVRSSSPMDNNDIIIAVFQ